MSTFRELFSINLWVVIALTGVFFVVFFYLCYIWSDMHKTRQRVEIAAMMTGIYGFVFFGAATAAAILVSLIIYYVGMVLKWVK
ncbi:MAG: hypothetical protein AAB620_02005 [Patescibacteria group bacterium]